MQFTTFGSNSRAGSYLLLIELREAAELVFGRFMGGRPISIAPGAYLYVGSALGNGRGACPLASRLVRHASRSGGQAPHAIRGPLIDFFAAGGYDPGRRSQHKKLHWHIDYLLDLPDAELSHIVMVMSPERLEHRIAEMVASTGSVFPVADRLGAQDAARGTHLFRIDDPATLLEQLDKSFLSEL